MKNKINRSQLLCLVFSICMMIPFCACEEDYTGKYKITDGLPVITFIRYQDNNSEERLLDGAFMGDNILIIGENLTSIQEVWFNNVQALLNINFVTKNTLFVNVPRDLPSVRTDKIYFITGQKDTVEYNNFEVKIPAPVINRMKCEFLPEGADVVVYGDYFLATDPSKIKVFIGDYEIPTSDIVSYEKAILVFKAPPMDIKGPLEVKTLYGASGRSKDIFRDDRGMITDFDDGFTSGGWGRPSAGQIQNDPELSLIGNYMRWEGSVDGDNWNGNYDNGWVFNYWGEEHGKPTGNLFPSDPVTSTFKFEANVLQAWSAFPMSILFYAQGQQESAIWDQGYPRGFWRPWAVNGESSPFITDGWITVSIPLSDFKWASNGNEAQIDFPTAFGGLTLVALHNNHPPHPGIPCNPIILIDNIRVVP